MHLPVIEPRSTQYILVHPVRLLPALAALLLGPDRRQAAIARPARPPSPQALKRPFERIDQRHRGGDCRPTGAGRGRPHRQGRSDCLREGLRPSRRGSVAGADDHRHGLRPRVAHQGDCHDPCRDDAGGAGPHPPQRSRVDVRARLRAIRQGRHHDSTPDDPRVGTAPRCRSRRAVDGIRRGHRARAKRSAHLRARASASSTATSTSFCSATSWRA